MSAKSKGKRKRISAGLLMYRRAPAGPLEVFIAHPGGPLFANKDLGAWSIPKGEIEDGDDPIETARREFEEETGIVPPEDDVLLPLGEITQKSGKRVFAWAFAGDHDGSPIESNLFDLEWPPRSGKIEQFPEIDRAEFVTLEVAAEKLNPAQVALITRLAEWLEVG